MLGWKLCFAKFGGESKEGDPRTVENDGRGEVNAGLASGLDGLLAAVGCRAGSCRCRGAKKRSLSQMRIGAATKIDE